MTTPVLAQIPPITPPTTLQELFLQWGWFLTVVGYVLLKLYSQWRSGRTKVDIKTAENVNDRATTDVNNANIVARLAVQALEFRERLDTETAARKTAETLIQELRDTLDNRELQSKERDREIKDLQEKAREAETQIRGLMAKLLEKDFMIAERNDKIAARDAEIADLKEQLADVRGRLDLLEHPPTAPAQAEGNAA